MKTQEKIVKDYQNKLQQVKIWLPKEESCGVDYLDLIRQRAAKLGFIANSGKNKGEGNINAYIISLLEKDLGIEIKSIREMNKNRDEQRLSRYIINLEKLSNDIVNNTSSVAITFFANNTVIDMHCQPEDICLDSNTLHISAGNTDVDMPLDHVAITYDPDDGYAITQGSLEVHVKFRAC